MNSRSVPGESSERGGRFRGLTAGLEAVAEFESVQGLAVEASDSSCNSDKSCEKENHVEEFETHCYISPGAFLGSTDDVDIVEVSQHGGREEEIDKGENSPDTLHASENAEKGGNTQKRRNPREPIPLPNLEIATPHNTSTKRNGQRLWTKRDSNEKSGGKREEFRKKIPKKAKSICTALRGNVQFMAI
jgi:hypothetical protein